MFGLADKDTVGVGAIARCCYGETVYLYPHTLMDNDMLTRTVVEIDATQVKAVAVDKLQCLKAIFSSIFLDSRKKQNNNIKYR